MFDTTRDILPGETSVILLLFVPDAASATRKGLAGLLYNTSGVTAYYKRDSDSASTVITLANITTLGTWVSGGFKQVDATNMPGVYEFHAPNAAWNAGAKEVVFTIRFPSTADAVEITFKVQLKVDVNVAQISGDSVAADNLEAATDGTGYNIGNGSVVAASVTGAVGSVTGAVGSVTGNVGGNVTGSVGSVSGTVNANVTQISGDSVAADNLESAADGTGYNLGGGSVVAASVAGAVGSVTGNVGGNVVGSVASVVAGVGLADGAITAAKIAADAITAAKIATGAIDADALAADAVTEIAAGILTTALTEAYATLGAAPTLSQLLFEVRARLTEASASGTTLTTKKLDGSTTAATYTTNSATAPTSITRAS